MKKEDIIANCIDEIRAGKYTLEDCLARYPKLSDELRPLLKIAIGIKPKRRTPSPDFRQRARIRLLQAMQAPADAGRRGLDIFGWLKLPAPGRRLSYALVVTTVVWALVIAGGTTVHASQDSLPDDALYPVKTAVENLRLAIARTPEARADLHLELAERRVQEVVAQSSLGRTMSTSALEEAAVQTDAAIREIGSIPPEDAKTLVGELSQSTVNQQVALGQIAEAAPEAAQLELQQALDAARRGNLIAKAAHGNPAYLSSPPSVSDEKLEAAYFKLKGTLLSAEGGTWNIGGLLLNNVNSPQGAPPAGSIVDIEGLVRGDEIFISKIKLKKGIDNQVKIAGVFGGTSSNGTVWHVGGIPIGQPQNIAPPPQGNQLQLTGIIQNGAFIVSKVATEEAKKGRVEISGVLVGVNVDESTIAVEVAGAQVTVNISEAAIESADGQPLGLVDLEPLVGEDIKVARPYVKDDLLYARKVYVDIEQVARPTDKEREEEEKKKDKDEEQEQEQEDKSKDKGKDRDRDKDEHEEQADDGDLDGEEQVDDEELDGEREQQNEDNDGEEDEEQEKSQDGDEGEGGEQVDAEGLDDNEKQEDQDNDDGEEQEQGGHEELDTDSNQEEDKGKGKNEGKDEEDDDRRPWSNWRKRHDDGDRQRWWNWWQHHDDDEELNEEEDKANDKDQDGDEKQADDEEPNDGEEEGQDDDDQED